MGDRIEVRTACYRGWITTLALELSRQGPDQLQAVAGLLHMGDEKLDYVFRNPPAELDEEMIEAAMDRVFERAGV